VDRYSFTVQDLHSLHLAAFSGAPWTPARVLVTRLYHDAFKDDLVLPQPCERLMAEM